MKPERLGRRVVYEGPWVNLYLDQVRMPNGHVIDEFHLLDFPTSAVGMVMEDGQGRLAMVRIPRYASGTTDWEIPAGRIEAGETELEAARREALEETGYTSDQHELLYSYYPMNGSANMIFHVVRCRALERVREPDPDEVSEMRWFGREETVRMLEAQAFADGLALTGILLWLRRA